MLYRLKPRFQRELRPVTQWLAARGVSANQLTLGALLLSLATGAAIAFWPDQRWPFLLLAGALFFRMALNALDGELARLRNMASRAGAALNDIEILLSEVFIAVPLAFASAVPATPMVIVLVLAVTAELTGMVPALGGGRRRLDGPMSKPDRALALAGLSLPLSLGAPSGLWLDVYLGAMAMLLLITIVNRTERTTRAEQRL